MSRVYGIMLALAIASIADIVIAQDKPSANGRTASVRLASVTTVNELPTPGLTESTRMVEGYFNNLSVLQANFHQTVTGDKTVSTGVFSLKRPGKFLWQYTHPVRQKIISTGTAVYYHDEERNQVTQLPVNAGLARLFNAKTLNLQREGLRAVSSKARSQELIVEFVVDKDVSARGNDGLKRLTIHFDKLAGGRLRLRQIDAVDSLSVTTRVEFSSVKENVVLADKMFRFTPGVYEQRN